MTFAHHHGDERERNPSCVLSYKRLDVYNCAIELLALAAEMLESIARTKGNAVIADQLKRAALSVPLNIGEGAGKSTPADQRTHRIATPAEHI